MKEYEKRLSDSSWKELSELAYELPYLWTALVPGQCVVYEWHASRAARCLDSLLGESFAGKLRCDGYSAYPSFAREHRAVDLLGCWAHARRNFFEAQEQAPRVAGWFLHQIGLLYRWEAELRKSRAGPTRRQVQRSSHHRMVIERLHRTLEKLQTRYLPQSLMGQALGYALNQWPMLEGFLDHGEVEIDNNLVENAFRPTAVGKKSWLFFGSEEAGQRIAVIYTLIENCWLHGVEPYTYLKDVLERLPATTNQQVKQLTRSSGSRPVSPPSNRRPETRSAPANPPSYPPWRPAPGGAALPLTRGRQSSRLNRTGTLSVASTSSTFASRHLRMSFPENE